MDNKLSKPTRIKHDWNRSLLSHCGRCDKWEMTITDSGGVPTCASCYDAATLSEWQCYAEQLLAELEAKDAPKDKRVTELEERLKLVREQRDNELITNSELEKRLATPVRLPEGLAQKIKVTGYYEALNEMMDCVRAAGFKCVGDE